MIYDELPTIDLVSWTVMIVGYTQARQPNDGLRLFADEIRSDLLPNSALLQVFFQRVRFL
ncbi:hypothetical protein Csa_021471, partial [Cucumis sativus]